MKAAVAKHWKAPPYYFHLKRGGHVAALQQHQANGHFLKLDLSDFFGSISRSRLSRALKSFFSHADALRIATASTVRHPENPNKTILPYGFVQSPLLASLVLQKSALGRFLDLLDKNKDTTVSVYVDDILVSSADPELLASISLDLTALTPKSGFVLNADKSEGPASTITAFNIQIESGHQLKIVERRLAELRDQIVNSTSDDERKGVIGNVRSVNPAQAMGFEAPPQVGA